MVDHYKENVGENLSGGKLDSYTRYEFQFSGLECRVLGSFYRGTDGNTYFGADVDNFYGPNNYSVYKPSGKMLEYIVNFREGGACQVGRETDGLARSDMRQAVGIRRACLSPCMYLHLTTSVSALPYSG